MTYVAIVICSRQNAMLVTKIFAIYFAHCLKGVTTMPNELKPKKPIDSRYPWAFCPNCGGSVYLYHIQEHIQNEETTYCEHCGQALDWSDDNDR